MKKKIITMLLVAVTLTTIPVTNSYATVTIDKTAQDAAKISGMRSIATAPQEESRLHVSDDVIGVFLKAGSRAIARS